MVMKNISMFRVCHLSLRNQDKADCIKCGKHVLLLYLLKVLTISIISSLNTC